MSMIESLARNKERLQDPIVLDWVLDRVDEERRLTLAQRPATELFDGDTLAKLLETCELDQVRGLFGTLPPAAFAPLTDRLLARWPEVDEVTVAELARVLVELAPERAFALFASTLSEPDIAQDIERLSSIGAALTETTAPGAKEVAAQWVAIARDVELPEPELPAALGVIHSLPEAAELTARLYKQGFEEDLGPLSDLISKTSLIALALAIPARDTDLRLADIAFLFVEDAPLKEIELLMKKGRIQIDDILRFVPETLPGTNGARLLAHLPPKEDMPRPLRGITGPLLVSALLDAYLQPTHDVSDFTLEETVDCLSLDLPENPAEDALVKHLATFPIEEVSTELDEVVQEPLPPLAAHGLLRALGRLGRPELVPQVLAILSESELEDPGAGMDALRRIGPDGLPFLEQVIKQASRDTSSRSWVPGLIAIIGGPAAADYLVNLVQREGLAQLEMWQDWLPVLPDPRLLPFVEKEIDRAPSEEIMASFGIVGTLLESKHPALARAREVALAADDEESDEVMMDGDDGEEEGEGAEGEGAEPAVADEPGRNDPCPCGSGKKYKKCCLKSED